VFPVATSKYSCANVAKWNIFVTGNIVSIDVQIPNLESTPSLLPVFKCNFDDVSDGTYVYDVYWYINGNNVTSYKNVPFSNIGTTVLRGSDWKHSYNMNMEVTF
jgi:hypothetical protein